MQYKEVEDHKVIASKIRVIANLYLEEDEVRYFEPLTRNLKTIIEVEKFIESPLTSNDLANLTELTADEQIEKQSKATFDYIKNGLIKDFKKSTMYTCLTTGTPVKYRGVVFEEGTSKGILLRASIWI